MKDQQNNDQLTKIENPTFGQKAVGINFNPSNDNLVDRCKQQFANSIDLMNEFRTSGNATPGQIRHASVAITMMEDAQMRAVKALTWKD